MVAPAVTYNGQRMPVNRPPPYFSQHTDEVRFLLFMRHHCGPTSLSQVLQELGYDVSQIEDLRSKRII